MAEHSSWLRCVHRWILIDARLGLGLEALGWAFAAFDAGGKLVAAAYGVPPKDVNTIQGAELWALKQALTFVTSPVAIYVDCKTVVGVRSGHHWIYSSKRRYHQHWVTIFQALDAGESAERVVWVPAHVSETRIGELSCGNSTPITKDMWLGNKLVDELAKRGPTPPKPHRTWYAVWVARRLQAQELAIFVGQVNALANAWPGADGEIRRDSTGMPQGVRRGNKRQRRASSGVGKGRSGGDVATPVAVVLPRVDATALPRPPPTPLPMVARARSLREAPRTKPPSVNGGGSRVICACHRPLVMDLKDSVQARGWMRFAGGGASLCATHRCASLVVF